jgi:MoaA/NifB/PqqE/SkfB family radical SAM enzyme
VSSESGEGHRLLEAVSMSGQNPLSTARVPNVAVAISNVCNLNCPMCEAQAARLPKGNMSYALFTRVIENLKRMGIRHVVLHNLNEPVLHPQIFQFLTHLEDNGIGVWLSSNGQALDSCVRRAQAQPRLPKRLVFRYSIDGGTPVTYADMRGGADFHALLANLCLIRDFCRQHGIQYRASCNYILSKKTAREVATFYRVFRCFFELKDIGFSLLAGNSVTGVNGFIRSNTLTPLVRRVPCDVPFEHMSVHYDGQVSLCCGDFNQEGIVGEFPAQSLEEIWAGEVFAKCRAAHNERRIDDLPALCRRCFHSARAGARETLNVRIRQLLADTQKDEHLANTEIYRYLTQSVAGVAAGPRRPCRQVKAH